MISKQGLVNFTSDTLRKGSKSKEIVSVNKIKTEEYYNQESTQLKAIKTHYTTDQAGP